MKKLPLVDKKLFRRIAMGRVKLAPKEIKPAPIQRTAMKKINLKNFSRRNGK